MPAGRSTRRLGAIPQPRRGMIRKSSSASTDANDPITKIFTVPLGPPRSEARPGGLARPERRPRSGPPRPPGAVLPPHRWWLRWSGHRPPVPPGTPRGAAPGRSGSCLKPSEAALAGLGEPGIRLRYGSGPSAEADRGTPGPPRPRSLPRDRSHGRPDGARRPAWGPRSGDRSSAAPRPQRAGLPVDRPARCRAPDPRPPRLIARTQSASGGSSAPSTTMPSPRARHPGPQGPPGGPDGSSRPHRRHQVPGTAGLKRAGSRSIEPTPPRSAPSHASACRRH